MRSLPSVSVIIPTYNRRQWLRETLDSLAQQEWPAAERFEVIIVDDGSEDGTAEIASETFPFPLRYFWQSNQGDAAARNTGAQQSQADILVFIDDDILLEPDFLRHLVRSHSASSNRIVVGTARLWLEVSNPLSQSLVQPGAADGQEEIVEMPFADICSNNMSIGRDAYFSVGMMKGLGFTGSSMWCDVDFAYRAYQMGFEFYRAARAICWHRDYVYQSLDSHKKRMRQAAYRAAHLFQTYPELPSYLPMFKDKMPVALHEDSYPLIARKLLRRLASSAPVLWSLEQVASFFERRRLASGLLSRLHLWIIGGHIFHGYRDGIREFMPAGRRK